MSDYLAHYGILGMKWGIRRFQPYSVRGRKSGKGGKEVGKAKQSGPSHDDLLKSTDPKKVYKYRNQLSDKELRDRVNRIQTEQQLEQLVRNSSANGKNYASKVLKQVEILSISAIAAGVVGVGKKKFTKVILPAIKTYGPEILSIIKNQGSWYPWD